MKAILLLAVLIASVSAVSKIEKLKKRWDIAEGISGAGAAGKVEGHEQTVRDAYAKLSAADKSVITNPVVANRPYLEALHTPVPLIMGLQYPDMPIGGASVQALGDDLTTPTHVNVATFGSFFKAGSMGARNTFVSQTHYGCLQFWHAMAPEPYVGGKYKVWTNAALSGLIKAGARRIWGVAINHLKKGTKEGKDLAEFHLGRILHTIGDSYAKGHTTRGPSSCGKIFIFQEYNAQKGNENHGSGDKPAQNQDTFSCAVTRINEVLQAWAGCVRNQGNCAYPTIIDSTFEVDPSVANLDAGGSLEYYAGPEAIKTGTKQTRTIAGKTVNVYFPATKGLTRVAGDSDPAHACPNF